MSENMIYNAQSFTKMKIHGHKIKNMYFMRTHTNEKIHITH